jgi:hypothetical protein
MRISNVLQFDIENKNNNSPNNSKNIISTTVVIKTGVWISEQTENKMGYVDLKRQYRFH